MIARSPSNLSGTIAKEFPANGRKGTKNLCAMLENEYGCMTIF